MSGDRGLQQGDKGRRAKRLQQEVNKILDRREFPWRKVRTDGAAGPSTFSAAHMAGWLIGLSDDQLQKIRNGDSITEHAYFLLTSQRPHSAAMKKRDRDRRTDAKKLRQLHKASQEPADGLAVWQDHIQTTPITVAAWIIGKAVGPDGNRTNWLKLAREAGWDGVLTSGYRTPEYSESLCYVMCNAPSCPGRCAGRSSNHSQKGPPLWGCFDCTDYETMERVLREIGAPLKNELDWRDPVHFSYTGN